MELFEDEIFLFGVIFLIGYISNLISNRINFPAITIYLLIGLLFSPSLFGLFPKEFIEGSSIIIDFAISIVAFIIGSSLKLESLKSYGKTIFNITLFQAQVPFFISTVVLFFTLPLFLDGEYSSSLYLSIALILGSLTSTTDPTATLAVIHQSKVRNSLSKTTLSIVAIDDAVAIVNFMFALILSSIILNSSNFSIISMALIPLKEISLSILIGVLAGFLTKFLMQFAEHKNQKIVLVFGVISIVFSLSNSFELNGFLSAITLGFTLTNIVNIDKINHSLEKYYEDIIFILFFIISGSHINVDIIFSIWAIVLIYAVSRLVGKLLGVYIGAKISNADDSLRKYLGFTLIPQGGVAIGLTMILYKEPNLKEVADLILNITLATVALNEIIGPILSKYGILKSKELEKSF